MSRRLRGSVVRCGCGRAAQRAERVASITSVLLLRLSARKRDLYVGVAAFCYTAPCSTTPRPHGLDRHRSDGDRGDGPRA
jgi:hypothetical protein